MYKTSVYTLVNGNV